MISTQAKNIKLFTAIAALAMIMVFSCKKPFTPPAIQAPNNYLVVSGVIDAGPDSTFIKLSRTIQLSSKTSNNPVSNALVTVESDQNTSYPLMETRPGIYASAGLNLDNTRKYRLRIKTTDKEYASDYSAVVNSPPIDSISYKIDVASGLTVYANTHDPKNGTRFYRWEYQETWIIKSHYYSYWASNGDTVLPRDLIHDNIYTCWKNDTSSNVVLGSSAALKNDVIFENPITFIPSNSEKFTLEYSILVKQYGLTSNAYNFWTNLKKNTEQLGSIFDAQPSENQGNIHCVTTPSEPVVGFVSIGSSVSQS